MCSPTWATSAPIRTHPCWSRAPLSKTSARWRKICCARRSKRSGRQPEGAQEISSGRRYGVHRRDLRFFLPADGCAAPAQSGGHQKYPARDGRGAAQPGRFRRYEPARRNRKRRLRAEAALMRLRSGLKLLEEREGTGEPAGKGDRVVYNLRTYLNRGEEVP